MDASLAAKWFLPDEVSPAADALKARFEEGQIEMAVPDLFWLEMANVLAIAVRAGRLSFPAGQHALANLREMGIAVWASEPFALEAFNLAVTWRRSAYDLFYVLLARAHQDVLITADERLVRALGHRFPVRSLASLSEW